MIYNNLLQEQKTELNLTPEMLRSMEILQMSILELHDYISEVANENPTIELESDFISEIENIKKRVSWIETDNWKIGSNEDEDYIIEKYGGANNYIENATLFLKSQLKSTELDKKVYSLAMYLIDSLDENGYIIQETIDHLVSLGIECNLIEKAILELQKLEPIGVGARNLSECLCLQLEKANAKESLAYDIAKNYLEELSKNQYSYLAKQMNVSKSEIIIAAGVIRKLNPQPISMADMNDKPEYIVPDAVIALIDGEWDIVLNDYYIPRITISNYYERLYKDTDDPTTKQYLQEKIKNTKWLIGCVSHRGKTLKLCLDVIIKLQQEWFSNNTQELLPMSLSELAETVGLHVSTVSRAVKGKYIQCQKGTYPIGFFISHNVGYNTVSQQAIKLKLLNIIKEENKENPLSDQMICQMLMGDGILLARRTVAKYREELNIGSTRQRKKK